MKTLKYTGEVDEREIDANAWKSVNVEDQGMVRWNQDNNFTAEVNDAAAQYLLDNDSGNFTDATPEQASASTDDESSEGDSAAKSGSKKGRTAR